MKSVVSRLGETDRSAFISLGFCWYLLQYILVPLGIILFAATAVGWFGYSIVGAPIMIPVGRRLQGLLLVYALGFTNGVI